MALGFAVELAGIVAVDCFDNRYHAVLVHFAVVRNLGCFVRLVIGCHLLCYQA